ncbi:uncharacterized protein [Dysidea avara]|uniref:uncharacterized protein isoform X1 n=1 Tax=Dysidea avara TaxID=196820 RepID=UPI00331AB72C
MSAIQKAITTNELSRHCRRRTRGADETFKNIEALLLQFTHATDSLGVPVFSKQMVPIWNEEKKHIPCIQDPPSVALYTVTGHIKKGGVELPVFRCARGTTVSNEEVQKIKALWDDLDPYDKRATEVLLKSQPLNLRGHFCGQKRTGHTTTEQMRRCILAGVSVPLSPLKSRVVKAICLLLCTRHNVSTRTSGAGGQKRAYLSKWKLILQDYTAIRARLYNSLDLLEGTNLALYAINQTTLVTHSIR